MSEPEKIEASYVLGGDLALVRAAKEMLTQVTSGEYATRRAVFAALIDLEEALVSELPDEITNRT